MSTLENLHAETRAERNNQTNPSGTASQVQSGAETQAIFQYSPEKGSDVVSYDVDPEKLAQYSANSKSTSYSENLYGDLPGEDNAVHTNEASQKHGMAEWLDIEPGSLADQYPEYAEFLRGLSEHTSRQEALGILQHDVYRDQGEEGLQKLYSLDTRVAQRTDTNKSSSTEIELAPKSILPAEKPTVTEVEVAEAGQQDAESEQKTVRRHAFAARMRAKVRENYQDIKDIYRGFIEGGIHPEGGKFSGSELNIALGGMAISGVYEGEVKSDNEILYKRTLNERLTETWFGRAIGGVAVAGVLANSVPMEDAPSSKGSEQSVVQTATTTGEQLETSLASLLNPGPLKENRESVVTETTSAESVAESETEQVNHSNEQHETAEEAPKPEITIEWIPETVKRHEQTIVRYAEKYQVSPDLIAITMTLESAGDVTAESNAKAQGPMQIWRPNSEAMGLSKEEIFNPETNVDVGTGMLKSISDRLLRTSSVPADANAVRAIASAYNGGDERAKLIMQSGFDTSVIKNRGKKGDRQNGLYAELAGQMWEERHLSASPTFEKWKKPVSEGGHNGYVLLNQAEEFWATMPETPKEAHEVKAASATEPEPTPETAEKEPQFGLPADPEDIDKISSCFGNRFHPIYEEVRPHHGLDLSAKEGVKVLAADEGVVVESNIGHPTKGYGKRVTIQHPDGSRTMYAHNSVNIAGVGQKVDKGVPIAEVGSTGGSTGPHIHFEKLNKDKNGNYYPVDITDDSFRIPSSIPNPNSC